MSHSDSLGLSFLIYKLKRLNNYICTYQHLVSNIQSICKISSCRYGQPNTSGGTRSHFGQVGISGHPFWFFFFFSQQDQGSMFTLLLQRALPKADTQEISLFGEPLQALLAPLTTDPTGPPGYGLHG